MSAKQQIIGQLEMVFNFTQMFTQDFTPEQAMVALEQRKNHLLWYLGHGGAVRDSIQALCTGVPSADTAWQEMFGNETEPKADAAAYPALDAVRSTLADKHGALIAFVQGLEEADLAKPVSKEVPGAPFLKTWNDAFTLVIADQFMHLGQILTLRKATGLPSPFANVEPPK